MSIAKIKKLPSDTSGKYVNKHGISTTAMKNVIAVSGLLCILSTIIFDKTQTIKTFIVPLAVLSAIALTSIFLAIKKWLSDFYAVLLMFAAGFAVRLNYVLITDVTRRVRQHDVFPFGGDKGHSAYIEHFYKHGFTLPDFNPATKAQFYHPPLHHFLSALWMRLLTTFGMSYERAITSLPFLTLFYSMCMLVVCERILDTLNLKGFGKLLPLMIITFHPTMILLSGSINNDNLALLFTLLAIYTTLKWYKMPSDKNIFFIALSIGLGMSTKMSVALSAPPVAMIFIVKILSENNRFKKYLIQYIKFGLVCFPLGLWFFIRNFIKYKLPITYVPRLSETADQYVGFRSVYERLIDLSQNPFKNIFINNTQSGGSYFEYNPFVSIIKSSVFGEYALTKYNPDVLIPCKILLILNIVMIILSIITSIYCLVKKNRYMDNLTKTFFVLYYVFLMVFFVKFSFDFPHTCSMDFRYLGVTVVIGAVFMGMFSEHIKLNHKKHSEVILFVRTFLFTAASAFSIFSVLVYTMIGKLGK